MPIYEYECARHGLFEIIQEINSDSIAVCPQCGQKATRIFSSPGIIRVHHTEKLPFNDSLRVYDRRRIMKDTAVKKALSNYAEEQREKPNSPYKWRE